MHGYKEEHTKITRKAGDWIIAIGNWYEKFTKDLDNRFSKQLEIAEWEANQK
eukprot:TRINITY_DN452_c0_g1_i2.p2 TRINITY_DN452_c0_g1~~TRINITY_DN452_c0_g1_i2.p2  ORF type:complete len:52 (+),score=11.56 TRINITY_DN452_c0_g1_i2:582-737(+)